MESQEKSWPIIWEVGVCGDWLLGGVVTGADTRLGEARQTTASSMAMKRTVRGDGVGDVPGRRTVGRRGVLEETRLGEGEEKGDAGGDAYCGIRKRVCCLEGCSLFAAIGLLLVDCISSDGA